MATIISRTIDLTTVIPTTPGTLGNIIAMAQRKVDQLVLQASGKWSQEWWTGLVNDVKRQVARETRFWQTEHKVQVVQYQQETKLPEDILTPLNSIFIGDSEVYVCSEREMRGYNERWRYRASYPNQPGGQTITLASSSNNEDNSVTVYGKNTDGEWQAETIALLSTTPSDSAKEWDDVYYFAVSGDGCLGDVSVTTAAGAEITTIPAGATTHGTPPLTGTPTHVVIAPPRLWWYPVPDSNYTAVIDSARIPPDFADLTDTLEGFPPEYDWVLAEGAAYMASNADLYTGSQDGRARYSASRYIAGMKLLKEHVDSFTKENDGCVGRRRQGYWSWERSVNLPLGE